MQARSRSIIHLAISSLCNIQKTKTSKTFKNTWVSLHIFGNSISVHFLKIKVRFWWHGLVANDTRQECKYERSILANAYVMKNKKTWPNHRLICTVLLSFFLFCADLQTVKYSNTKSWYQTKRMKPQAEQCCFFYLTDREEFWLFVANFSAELLVQYTFNSFLGGVLSCKYPEIYEHFWIPFAMLRTVIKLKIEILEVLNMNALDWHNHI